MIRHAIADVAEDRLAARPCLGSALLDRAVPARLDDVIRAGMSLDGQVLAVQGPPGSGKTTVGAELIRALIDEGKTVGVAAGSHAVIGNFLSRVGRPAVQKCGDGQMPFLARRIGVAAPSEFRAGKAPVWWLR